MPSTVRSTSPHTSNPIQQKNKFRTVLGFGPNTFRDSSDTDSPQQQPSANTVGRNFSFARKSIDTTRNYTARRKNRADRLSVTDISFFQERTTTSPDITTATTTTSPPVSAATQPPIVDLTIDDMKEVTQPHPSARRPPVRMDNNDGPWSVSVAETPNDARSYSLYIKTPTHNLTLTRTAMEIVDLDLRLREAHAGVKIPTLPINVDSLPTPPPKRKSTFLNTLSRLASPTSAKSNRQSSNSKRANNLSTPASSGLPTPLPSPPSEVNDPFSSFNTSNVTSTLMSAPSTTSTGIAAYLTTISNIPALRQARVWKRFVRVRTDDLESVRVERAIKRVRSDLAAHHGAGKDKDHVRRGSSVTSSNGPGAASSATPSETGSVYEEKVNGHSEHHVQEDTASVSAVPKEDDIKEEEEEEDELKAAVATALPDDDADVATVNDADATSKLIDGSTDITPPTPPEADVVPSPAADATSEVPAAPSASAAPPQEPEEAPSTPIATDAPPTSATSRMHRSQSADPDKSSRLTRAYAASTSPSQDGASSQAEQTGDESSISTTNGSRRASARKKRSMSSAPKEPKKSQRKVVIDDFEMMRVLGKGCAGKVLLVRHKQTSDLFALKAITKRHVLAHQELQHTLTEQAVLKRMAAESRDPFVVKLWWSFHDKENLFLVMDFHPGGDLATQLARWGRLGRDRARFYAAEIVEGVEGLHAAGVIYRDLKPENILIGADGHIVLTDFGLSKEFPRRSTSASTPITPSGSRGGEFYSSVPGTPQPVTPPWMKTEKGGELALGWPGQPIGHSDSTTTFCGTAEYLAPEVIQGLPYSYEVDWWSFGTMLYEMLTGITPFWANNHSDMYVRVLQDELQFPDDRAIDQDTKSLIRGLLQRNPALRICEPRIKRHPYFSMIDWSHVYYKRYIPPYIPPIDPSNASDTQNFDDTFLDMEPVLDDFNDADGATDTDQEPQTESDRTDGEETSTTPSQSRSSSIRPQPQLSTEPEEETVDVFDGYSFKGRHSVLIDDEDEGDGSEGDSEDAEDEDDSSILNDLDIPLETAKPPLPTEEDVAEPKTPEARPAVPAEPVPDDVEVLPPAELTPAEPKETIVPVVPPVVEDSKARKSKDLPAPGPSDSDPPSVPVKESKTKIVAPPSKAVPRPTNKSTRNRREKSGVPALDRYLADATGEDTEAMTEAERDEDDDDWDFVEAADGEDRNGAKGTSLFARGVVDRYRLAVFRKASTPSQRSQPRSFSGMSGMSKSSEISESTDSPSPSQRRGRTPLTFRKQRQFLRPKSPPSSYSSKTSMTARSLTNSNANTLSAVSMSSNSGLLTPSHSMGSMPMSPSLKSKESAISVGAQSMSSDQSGANGVSPGGPDGPLPSDTIKGSPPTDEPEKQQKNKKLKKYKENAEKVFSLFSSPRQPS
ncbi:hypothetical protein BDQ12DRAFT_677671 [Crucibulum laeve]|uniref:non-specific serine/threonine protein kinase n=1 Tax=Crucibulum laeve TaxID=68775 RepID=A0A5C3ME49_9AGAR|nr:hypothetical protein BDQ12DRAFT_677671 [Crucibulum laeve]